MEMYISSFVMVSKEEQSLTETFFMVEMSVWSLLHTWILDI